MKNFFLSVKNWIVRHLPTKRRLIQVYVALLYNVNFKGFANGTIFQDNSKYACVPGLNCYSCPGAIGACPLGALQNAFAQSGTRAPYYILGIIGLFGLLFARTICGFLCPVGLCQELIHKIPSVKIKKGRATRALSYLKYVLLVVLVVALPVMYGLQGIAVPAFCKFICPAGTFEGGIGLISNPLNWSGSRDLLAQLGNIFTWKFCVLIVFIVLCVFLYRPFCRFICPLGAIYGFFNKISFIGVKVDKIKCIDCGLCVKHCQMDVKHVGDHECINCGRCISVCPVKAISWKGSGLFDKLDQKEEEKKEEKPAPTPVLKSVAPTPVLATATAQNGAPKIESTLPPPYMPVTFMSAAAAEPEANKSTNEDGDIEFRSGAPPPAEKKARPKSFWIQVAAWCVALVAFIGAVLYYNVFTTTEEINDMQIGTECPDFSLKTYGKGSTGSYKLLDDTFTLSEQRGSVVVINFWATWCGPCVEEIPHFNKAATEFPDVKVVAIHGKSTESVPQFIIRPTDTKESWRDYNLIFLQDDLDGQTCLTFKALGGNATWPMTLIVDAEGKISFTRQGKLSYEDLVKEIQKAQNAHTN